MANPTEHPRVPILDLSAELSANWDEMLTAIQGVLKSTQFILGPNVQAFEQEIARYLGVKFAVGMNSGTDALVIGLRALAVGPGDEVVTPSFSFFATAEAASLVGAKPVFADIDPDSLCVDPNDLRRKISPKTKAIIPVHLFGQAAAMKEIVAISQETGIPILEDVAQAFGARHADRLTGTFGAMAAYSFFPTKNLGAYGDAGMIVTDDPRLAELAQKLRVHGSKQRYHHDLVGYNSRLDEMQAAVLRVKFPHINKQNEKRRLAAVRYQEMLHGTVGVTAPREVKGTQHVFNVYTVRVHGGKRDAVKAAMEAQGVSTMIYYPIPIHRLPMYLSSTDSLPQTDAAAAEVLSLPIWPEITPDQQLRVCQTLADAITAL